jgi:TetR/AcrR family transcriptional repressor of nem operon
MAIAKSRMGERTRINDPQKMRGRILDAAADLFQSGGYNATSMQAVMAAAGVTGGALHHHFATKKQLGLAVVKERVAPAVRESWIEPVKRASDPVEGIREAFEAIRSGLSSQGYVRGCPLNNLAIELAYVDADFRDSLQGIFAEWRDAIAGRLAAREGARKPGATESADLAAFVVATYSGAMAMAKAEQSTAPMEAAWRVLQQSLR